ncbi:MAG: type VI secretion system contractile sheath large subunit, partial [Planctomycetes bacterium]|nr:type VI secretion system contractile sheath large subunit [Planctomycetota bacterium]
MSEEQKNESQQPEAAEAAGFSLLDEIMEQTKMSPDDESYAVARRGVEAFIGEMLAPKSSYEKADKTAVDQMIAEIDRKMSQQIDQILHHKDVQKLESAWRGLKFVIDRTDFREGNKVELLNISKEQLLEDFEDSPEVVRSGLYKLAYTAEYGQFGGEPYAAMISNYDFGPGAQDIALLQNCASVASMAHAPFIAAAGPKFFGLDEDFQGLANLKDLDSVFEGPQYTKWNSFRESEDARYVGLTAPRFLLRTPYGEDNPVKAFDYKESVDQGHNSYLWGNTSFAFATKLTESFAQYRWCPNIIGPLSGGAVEDLPLHQYEANGATET